MVNEKNVRLTGWLHNSEQGWDAEDYACCGTRGCGEQEGMFSANEIHEKEREMSSEEVEKRRKIIVKESAGRKHGAILDHANFQYCIDNLSRASTLFLCAPEYASHLQQSLRRSSADRGFHLPSQMVGGEAESLMKRQFKLYDEMVAEKINGEDARFILPLYTKTNLNNTLWDARELLHMESMAQRMFVPSEVKDTAEQIYELARKKAPHLLEKTEGKQEVLDWFPSSQLFAQKNEGLESIIFGMRSEEIGLVDAGSLHLDEEYIRRAVESRDEAELANLKHYHFTFLAPMSLATFHQATRQRTWNQSVEPLTSAVITGNYVVPPTIQKTRFEDDFKSLMEESITFVSQNISDADSFGVLPHALSVYDLIHINGWNGIYSVGKRTCKTAQWEIRGIAKSMADEIRNVAPELGKYSVPQGILYGSCPERSNCGRCSKR